MATKGITIREKTATGYDVLHPETSLPQVKDLEKLLSLLQNYRSDLLPEQTIPISIENITQKVRLSDLLQYIQDHISSGVRVVVSSAEPSNQREGDFWYQIVE